MIRPRQTKQVQEAEALPLSACFAKTIVKNNLSRFGQTVFDHCFIVGKVAEVILQTMPDALRDKWFPKGTSLVVASHDIGKVSPTFQKKIYCAVLHDETTFPQVLKSVDATVEKGWGHAGVSCLAATAWDVGCYIPKILGCHHGKKPHISLLRPDSEVVGGNCWQEKRKELTTLLQRRLNSGWPSIQTNTQAKLIAGLTTVSDWIGSGSSLEDMDGNVSHEVLESCVRMAGYQKVEVVPNLSFEDIFRFPPKAIQSEIFTQCTKPGVYILEAPMGVGKTESALYMAYLMLASGQANGLYFALPTQLTSECIHSRVNAFLSKILPQDSLAQEAMLVHSSAWLKNCSMGADAAVGASWFSQKKRGILAPFGVGTIDQALMAVMNVKHGFVRTFGLMGKVVILDEVHTYDMYTGTILDELVRTLVQIGCTVIILSATLTQSRREALLDRSTKANQYPLLSLVTEDEVEALEVSLPCRQGNTVSVEMTADETSVIEDVIGHAKDGEQILWVENTVAEAQQIYRCLSVAVEGKCIEIGLIHSRFTKIDRSERESYWVNVLGKSGKDRSLRGRILIGTQVLEQSLDIDADLLVTRICPTDMLLQRIGRLWRHEGINRPHNSSCRAVILGPSLEDALKDAKKAYGTSANVYAPYVLCRTLEQWQDIRKVSLPDDIRTLLEKTYAEREESANFASLKFAMESGDTVHGHRRLGVNGLRQLALSGLSDFAPEADDDNPPTRYGDIETNDVLILRGIERSPDGVQITLCDGQKFQLPHEQGTDAAMALMNNCVSLPCYLVPKPDSLEALSWLKGTLYLSQFEESRIRIAVVDNTSSVCSLSGQKCNAMKYDKAMGFHKE